MLFGHFHKEMINESQAEIAEINSNFRDMRLKSQHLAMAAAGTLRNHRIKSCIANIFMLLLLASEFGSTLPSSLGAKQHRLRRQLKAKRIVNYDDNNSMTNLNHQPHFTGNRSVILQLFEWKFLDIAEECRLFLGPQGYAGVQISPALEHTVVKTSQLNHPWWERYEVISYRLASRSGNESDFWTMSRICNDNGVRIYADVVLNHMAAPLHLLDARAADNEDFIVNTLLETNVNISQGYYSNVTYTQKDFHQPICMLEPKTQNAYEIRNCQMRGHPDLDHERIAVQQHIVEMLNKFIDMGVAGFRVDSAKYTWPIDMKNIFSQVKNLNIEFDFKEDSRPFVYYDVFDLGLDTISKTEYITYGVVSEYLYPAELATIFRRKVPLSSLINWGPALGFMPHEDSLVFIDSHDTQRGLPLQLGNNRMLTYKERIKYIMANVFMLIHPFGKIKRLMSSYYFPEEDTNQGPPTEDEEGDEIKSPEFDEQNKCTKDSGWVCEHRWPELASMIKVANYFHLSPPEDQCITNFQTNGPNQVAFCRGDKAFVAINNDHERDFVKELYACLEPGIYCDMVTGGKKEEAEECHGKQVEVNEQGYIQLMLAVVDDDVEEGGVEDENEEDLGKVESYGILVIYKESKIEDKEETVEQGIEAPSKEVPDDPGEPQETDVEENEEAKEEEEGGEDEAGDDPVEETEGEGTEGDDADGEAGEEAPEGEEAEGEKAEEGEEVAEGEEAAEEEEAEEEGEGEEENAEDPEEEEEEAEGEE